MHLRKWFISSSVWLGMGLSMWGGLWACSTSSVERKPFLERPHSAFEGAYNMSSAPELARTLSPAVVRITTSNGFGTGFFVSKEGHLVTNTHVISNEECYREGCLVDLRFNFAFGEAYRDVEVFVKPLSYHPARDIFVGLVKQVQNKGATLSLSHVEVPLALSLAEPQKCKKAKDLVGQQVFTVGHMMAGLKRYGAFEVARASNYVFVLRGSTAGGASGSPVFVADTGELAGILYGNIGAAHPYATHSYRRGVLKGEILVSDASGVCEVVHQPPDPKNIIHLPAYSVAGINVLKTLQEFVHKPESFDVQAKVKLLNSFEKISKYRFLYDQNVTPWSVALDQATSSMDQVKTALAKDVLAGCRIMAENITNHGAPHLSDMLTTSHPQAQVCWLAMSLDPEFLEKVAPFEAWQTVIRTLVEYDHGLFHGPTLVDPWLEFIRRWGEVKHWDVPAVQRKEVERLWSMQPFRPEDPYDVGLALLLDGIQPAYVLEQAIKGLFEDKRLDAALQRVDGAGGPILMLQLLIQARSKGFLPEENIDHLVNFILFHKNVSLYERFQIEMLLSSEFARMSVVSHRRQP